SIRGPARACDMLGQDVALSGGPSQGSNLIAVGGQADIRSGSATTAIRPKVSGMTTKHEHDNPILVTGAAGAVGGVGRSLSEFLLARGHKVRALVRREDERAEALRRLGAEVVEGDLTDLASMHRAIEGCGRIYFGMSLSA